MRLLAGPDLLRRSPDAGGLERTSRNPGCPTNDRRAGCAGGTAFPTLQGSKTSDAERLLEARRDVTMLAIFWDPEHKVLTYVYSGSVVRFRSAFCGRSGRVSCVHNQRGEMVESMRYGSDQVHGRHLFLVTGASCCGVPFTPTSRKIKGSEAITSAGILWVLRRRSPHLRILRLRSPSLGCLGRVAGPRRVGAYHSGHLL